MESNSPSEDESPQKDPLKVSEDLPISPSEDVKSYGDLIRKVVTTLGLPYIEPKEHVEDIVFDVVQ